MEGEFKLGKGKWDKNKFYQEIQFVGTGDKNGEIFITSLPVQDKNVHGVRPSASEYLQQEIYLANRGLPVVSGTSSDFNTLESLMSEARFKGMQTLTEEERAKGIVNEWSDTQLRRKYARDTLFEGKHELTQLVKEQGINIVNIIRNMFRKKDK